MRLHQLSEIPHPRSLKPCRMPRQEIHKSASPPTTKKIASSGVRLHQVPFDTSFVARKNWSVNAKPIRRTAPAAPTVEIRMLTAAARSGVFFRQKAVMRYTATAKTPMSSPQKVSWFTGLLEAVVDRAFAKEPQDVVHAGQQRRLQWRQSKLQQGLLEHHPVHQPQRRLTHQ